MGGSNEGEDEGRGRVLPFPADRRGAPRPPGGGGGFVVDLALHRTARSAPPPDPPEAPAWQPWRAAPVDYRVTVELDGSVPLIWRGLGLRSDLSLPQVYEAVRTSMGWAGVLLHHFRVAPGGSDAVTLSPPYGSWARSHHDEREVRLDEVLAAPGDRLRLAVIDDFGDEWWHVVELREVRPVPDPLPARCLAGARACPDGEVDGIGSYNVAVAQWTQGRPPRQRFVSWPESHDPEAFGVAEADALLALLVPDAAVPAFDERAAHPRLAELRHRCTDDGRAALDVLVDRAALRERPGPPPEAGLVVRDWTRLLDLVGDGVDDAGDGAAWADRLDERRAEARGPRGADARSLARLAVGAGLLRRRHGRLVPTAAARRARRDPERLWEHLAGRLVAAVPTRTRDTVLVVLLELAAGAPAPSPPLVARVLGSAGHTDGGEPVTAESARRRLPGAMAVLDTFGGIRPGRDGPEVPTRAAASRAPPWPPPRRRVAAARRPDGAGRRAGGRLGSRPCPIHPPAPGRPS